MLLTKDQILNADARQFVEVDIPELGGEVRIGTITAAEKGKYEMSMFKFKPDGTRIFDQKNGQSFRTRFIAACIVDDEGNQMFKGSDVEILGNLPAPVVEKIFTACQDLNGMAPEDVDEIEGNSD